MVDGAHTGLWRLSLPMPRHFLRAVNLYLLRDADGYVLIDCGLPIAEAWQALMEQLDALGGAGERHPHDHRDARPPGPLRAGGASWGAL